jgi:hypothetical protein
VCVLRRHQHEHAVGLPGQWQLLEDFAKKIAESWSVDNTITKAHWCSSVDAPFDSSSCSKSCRSRYIPKVTEIGYTQHVLHVLNKDHSRDLACGAAKGGKS